MHPQVIVRSLKRTGGRNVRKDAIARANSGGVSALCLEFSRELETTRFFSAVLEIAIVASKKQVSKRAVQRNKTKRRVRAALTSLDFAQIADKIKTRGVAQIKILLVCRRPVLEVSFETLKEQLQTCLTKLVSQLPFQETN